MWNFLLLPKMRKDSGDNNQTRTIDGRKLLNERTFTTLFENHPDAVFVVDLKRKIVHYNKSVRTTFGYDEENVSNEFDRYFFKGDFERKHFQTALKGTAQNFQSVVLHKSGRHMNVDITYIPLMNQDMQVIAVYAITKDITAYIQHEEEVDKIKSSLELAQKVGRIGSWDYDIKNQELYLSKQFLEFNNREKKHDHFPNLEDGLHYVHPEDRNRYRNILRQALQECKGYKLEYRILRQDGTFIYVSELVEMILDDNGNPIRLVGTTQDITKSKVAENKLYESEQRFEHILENLSLGIRSFDVQKKEIILITPGMEDVTGYPSEYFYEKDSWNSIIHPDDLAYYLNEYSMLMNGKCLNLQYRITHKNGETVWVQDKTIPVLDSEGKLFRTDGFVSDISEQKEYERKIQYLAYHDHLTNLPNLKPFNQKIESLIAKASEAEETFSILLLDLDRFRNINNTLGHRIGDKLLQQFSQRINLLLPKASLFSRIDGAEFGVVLWNYDQADYPEKVAKIIIDSLNQPFMIEDFELFITACIGISTYPSNGTTVEGITKNADLALHRAKSSGKNNYQIYSSTLDIPSYKQYELERDLRKSIEKEQLIIHFQPRVEASTGKIISAEALVRWEHPVWGLVAPNEFIPLAEENGFINDIGDWVFRQVCRYISDWKRDKLPVVPISVNITAQRFLRSDWKSTFINILKETDVDPSLIEFEITETNIIQHEKVVETALQFIKSLGIKIALDDFGTGYSSLSHIKDLSIDTIKIDQSFVRQITKTPNVEIIIKSIIFMANALNMNVVAEGVETFEQLAFLKQQECAEIQGYIFSKPIPEKDFQNLLKRFFLRPAIRSEKPKIKERRKYYRIELLSPLKANMTLTTIQGREVKLGRTEALIEDIGPGGLRFLSTIQLPVRPDIIYKFVTIILGEKLELYGHITWKNEIKDIFQYGLEFTIDEKERDYLIKKLNNFSLQLKNQAFPPECNFISEDKITYLKKLQATG